MTTTAPPSRPTATPTPRAPTTHAEPLLRRLVGRILRERRNDAGRTLRDVAADARVSVAYLSEIERGRKEASSEVLVAVCGALGMSLADLLAAAHRDLTATPAPRRLTVRPPVPVRHLTALPSAEMSLSVASVELEATKNDISAEGTGAQGAPRVMALAA